MLLVEPDLFPAATGRSILSQPGAEVNQSCGPQDAHSTSGRAIEHSKRAQRSGDAVTLSDEGNMTACGVLNRAGSTTVVRERVPVGVASGSSLTSSTTPRSPRGPNARTTVHSPPSSPPSISSPHPTWGSPTTSRHHLNFILNHGPESPLLRAATLPRQIDRRADSEQSPLPDYANVDGPTTPSAPPPTTTMSGWSKLWSTFRTCLEDRQRSVDVTVPSQLGEILASSGSFQDVVVKQANVPVGFWPQGETWITYDIPFPIPPPRRLIAEGCRRGSSRTSLTWSGIRRCPVNLSCPLLHLIDPTTAINELTVY